MARNKLTDLNNHLFEQLERLNDDTLTEDKLKQEINRATAMSNIGNTLVNNAKVILMAYKRQNPDSDYVPEIFSSSLQTKQIG